MGRIIPHLISCVSQFSLLSEEKWETQRLLVHMQNLINSRFFVSIGFYMNAKLTVKPMCKEQLPLFPVQRKLGLGQAVCKGRPAFQAQGCAGTLELFYLSINNEKEHILIYLQLK